MSIPIYENGCPDYRNMSSFPVNIYDNEKVMPLSYYKRDVLPNNNFEVILNRTKKNINPNIAGRWSWGLFPNGYGEANLVGKNNAPQPEKGFGCSAFSGRCRVNKEIGNTPWVSCDDPHHKNVKYISDKTKFVSEYCYKNNL